MASAERPSERLTARELEVLKLIATGLSRKEIASSLKISVRTVEFHRSRIMEKLDIHDIANLTRYAIRNGHVDLGPANRRRHDIPLELFERVRIAEAKYRIATAEYGAFLLERESLGLTNPDGATGARRLRQSEEFAHKEYHAALVALKDFLVRSN